MESVDKKEFGVPIGFTRASNLNMSPASTADYKRDGMTVPEPGQYFINNDVIAAVTSDGEVVVWIEKQDPNAPRTVTAEQAIKNLEEAGYTKSQFGVPVG